MTTTIENDVHLRQPGASDGAAAWKLVCESPPLEANSCYAYLLLCEHFRDTCVIAERNGDVIGFVAAYRPPNQPDTVFVWQIAVHESARGQGLARTMLRHLLMRDVCKAVKYMDTTVTPSNEASRRTFHGLARSLDVPCAEYTLFSANQFGGDNHEDEVQIHIGPMALHSS